MFGSNKKSIGPNPHEQKKMNDSITLSIAKLRIAASLFTGILFARKVAQMQAGKLSAVAAVAEDVLSFSAGTELLNHEQKLIFQADGNLVHYSGESVVWSPGCKYDQASDDCILKSDGTLVIYRTNVMMMRIGVPSDDVNTSYTIEWDDTGNQCFKIVGTGDTTTSTLLNSSVFVWRYSDYAIFGPGERMAELDDGTSLALSSEGILEHLYSDGSVRMALNVGTTTKAVACRVESDGTVVLYAGFSIFIILFSLLSLFRVVQPADGGTPRVAVSTRVRRRFDSGTRESLSPRRHDRSRARAHGFGCSPSL